MRGRRVSSGGRLDDYYTSRSQYYPVVASSLESTGADDLPVSRRGAVRSPRAAVDTLPLVTVVMLTYNRCDKVRVTLQQTLAGDYPGDRLEVIVVDNASEDDTVDMLTREFPGVRVISHARNLGASGWNDGFAAAAGEYVLILDDDCYLPPGGLTAAVCAAGREQADLVSFTVVSTEDPSWVFTERHRMGLFMFWGCAALIRRDVIAVLGGYDPEIFMLVNELELMLRFYDRGFRHLHIPEIAAQHMKRIPGHEIELPGYRLNLRNYAYVSAKLLHKRDALGALIALVARIALDTLRTHRAQSAQSRMCCAVSCMVYAAARRSPTARCRAAIGATLRRWPARGG